MALLEEQDDDEELTIGLTLKQPEPEVDVDVIINDLEAAEWRVFYWHKWFMKLSREMRNAI